MSTTEEAATSPSAQPAATPTTAGPSSGSADAARATSRWLSPNPDRAWVEKFFLAYSPVWMASMAVMMLTNGDETASNGLLLAHAFVTAAPVVVVPALVARRFTDRPWHDSYWFKANLYLLVFGAFGNYFGSEYFFDVLGMVYEYPNATTTLDSALVGQGRQSVPLIMYAYTHVYFMTYHVTAALVLRRIRGLGWRPQWPVFAAAVFVVGYVWAFLETKAMANPIMESTFRYEKLDVMLQWGSAIYATYFVASFPIWFFLDEDRERPWPLHHVVGGALAASMLTLTMLDIAAHLVGSL